VLISVETVGKIRRRHLVKGECISKIARETGLSRNTVKRYLRNAVFEPRYRPPARQVQPKLGPFVARLEELLRDDEKRAVRERRTAQRLFEALPPGVDRLLADLALLGRLGNRGPFGFPQDRDHLLVRESTLSHQLFLIGEEPSFRRSGVRKSRAGHFGASAAHAVTLRPRHRPSGGEARRQAR
jgi:hypothetical protein